MHGGTLRAQETIKTIKVVGPMLFDVELKLPTPAFADAITKRSATIIQSVSTRYRIEFPQGFESPTRAVFEAAAEVGAQVRVFSHAQRTLEDAFLEAVR
jgi:hypothetical protein